MVPYSTVRSVQYIYGMMEMLDAVRVCMYHTVYNVYLLELLSQYIKSLRIKSLHISTCARLAYRQMALSSSMPN